MHQFREDTELAWKWSLCRSLPNQSRTAAASLLMVSYMDHPSSQHGLLAIRTTSWLPFNGAAASSSLSVFILRLPPPSLPCLTNSVSSLPFFLLSPNNVSTIFHLDTQRSSRLSAPHPSLAQSMQLPELHLTPDFKV